MNYTKIGGSVLGAATVAGGGAALLPGVGSSDQSIVLVAVFAAIVSAAFTIRLHWRQNKSINEG